ncbi:MAG TPA: nitronate monooxygenase [Marmoricola sp.]|nr:nitronate monooxygenase [Marmoricola sp.]
MTWLQETLGIRVPVVGAPMAGPGDGHLAHAVSQAGALGMVGVGSTRDGAWIAEQASVAAAGGTPYGIGLMAWALADNPGQLDAVLALDPAPALVSVSFGGFAEPVRRLRAAGLRTATQIGNLADLRTAVDAGVDVVVARGAEAGGHGRNEMATLPLLQLVLAEAGRLPVLAAGGILDHRGVTAVLAAGAAGAWVGTAFLGCVEAASSPAARQALLAATDTGYGRVFDVAQRAPWPREFGGRAVRNDFFDRWVGREDEMDDAARAEHAAAVEAADFETAHLYAGQAVAGLRAERTAAEVVAALTPR